MDIRIIAAFNKQGIIGKGLELPWRYKKDLKRFKELTCGHPVIMGRKTWESIGKKPLPGRANIVISRVAPKETPTGYIVEKSLEKAIIRAASCPGADTVWIIGGGQVYSQAMKYARYLDLTLVHDRVEGEGLVYFPEIDMNQWEMIDLEITKDDENGKEIFFLTYRRM